MTGGLLGLPSSQPWSDRGRRRGPDDTQRASCRSVRPRATYARPSAPTRTAPATTGRPMANVRRIQTPCSLCAHSRAALARAWSRWARKSCRYDAADAVMTVRRAGETDRASRLPLHIRDVVESPWCKGERNANQACTTRAGASRRCTSSRALASSTVRPRWRSRKRSSTRFAMRTRRPPSRPLRERRVIRAPGVAVQGGRGALQEF